MADAPPRVKGAVVFGHKPVPDLVWERRNTTTTEGMVYRERSTVFRSKIWTACNQQLESIPKVSSR